MKIGVTFPQNEFGNDPGAIREFAQTVEGLGFRHFLAYDHVLSADTTNRPDWGARYDLDDPFHEIFVLFGYVAALTTSLELISGVLVLPQRQTALVAKQAAEIDLLSGGRLRLGVGVGWNEVEFDALGKSFHDRGARCEEQIALLRALWTNESITFEGRWESVVEAGINPLPVQRPIPVWIGGYIDTTLKRVARIGDGYFPRGGPDEAMRSLIARLREYAVAEGRDPGSIGIHPQLPVGAGTPDDWRANAEAWRGLDVSDLSVNTLRAGLSTPAEHLRLIEQAAAALFS